MEIRKIKPEELQETIELAWRVFLKFEAPDYSEEGIEEFRKSINDPEFVNRLEIYVAIEDNNVIGMIATRDMNHIAMYFVDEEYQGKGIGRSLYNTVCELNTDNYFTVNASPYAKEIYEHMGFVCAQDMQEVNGIKFYPMKGIIKNKVLKEESLLKKFCEEYNLGSLISISQLTGGLMHKMFKVETTNGIYAIKILNPEVMKRDTAYNNFVVSETIANKAKRNGVPVSSALKINDNFIINYDDSYFMVFDFVDGKTLKDDEITVEHCQKIGEILSQIHNLDYSSLGLDTEIKEDKFYVEWKSFIDNENFNNMSYKDLYLENCAKYYEILQTVIERLNASNNTLALCHRDMDPKNVMWANGNPIVIDWESASLANPYRELVEDALCWSGFLTNNFNEDKFLAVVNEYAKNNNISDVDWDSIIYGNLVGRFGWLDYNLKRSLGLKSNDAEEMKLAETEVTKTIDEINRYLNLVNTMRSIFNRLVVKSSKMI